METSLVNSVVAYILFLLSVAGSVSLIVEQLKPLLFNKILEKSGENVYLVSIYLARTVGAFVGIALLGGYPILVELVPFLAKVPELGAWVISVLLVSLGADYLHVILDFLYAVRDGNRDTSGGENGAVSDIGASESDIAALVSQLNARSFSKPAIKNGGSVSTADLVDALG